MTCSRACKNCNGESCDNASVALVYSEEIDDMLEMRREDEINERDNEENDCILEGTEDDEISDMLEMQCVDEINERDNEENECTLNSTDD